MTSATEILRRMLDERGVEYDTAATVIGETVATFWHDRDGYPCSAIEGADDIPDGEVSVQACITPEQAIAATVGRGTWVNPTWERWHRSLRHDEIKSIGDAVEQLMYEVIEFGGDMGPNGNTYNGIDEGDVLTSGFINEWIERIATLGSCNCSNNCTNGERTETCEADETDLIPFVRADSGDFEVDYIHVMECTECGHVYEHVNGDYEYCPRCGRKRRDVEE